MKAHYLHESIIIFGNLDWESSHNYYVTGNMTLKATECTVSLFNEELRLQMRRPREMQMSASRHGIYVTLKCRILAPAYYLFAVIYNYNYYPEKYEFSKKYQVQFKSIFIYNSDITWLDSVNIARNNSTHTRLKTTLTEPGRWGTETKWFWKFGIRIWRIFQSTPAK